MLSEILNNQTIENQTIMVFWSDVDFSEDSSKVFFCDEDREIGMNYFYLIGTNRECRFTQSDADKLEGLPLAIVYYAPFDMWGLVLTGGGMDLSWEICEGFIRLGYLPPSTMCKLPNFASMKWTEDREMIFSACLRSLEIQTRWLEDSTESLCRLKKQHTK